MKNKFICPVCGYPELEEDASTSYHTYEICPCCFSQSGFDLFPEFPETIIELRIAWIKDGAKWQSKILKKYGFLCDPIPKDWDAIGQMRKAGFFSIEKWKTII